MIEWIHKIGQDHFHEDVDAEVYERDGQGGWKEERQDAQEEGG
jgi:hypothetical protein